MMEAHVDGCSVQHHNPGVLFDEAVLPYGAAVLATCAFNWLSMVIKGLHSLLPIAVGRGKCRSQTL